jgi:flagellar biosynthesis GTPase FlhF
VTEKTVQKIDIFISSPSDVTEERKIASEVIEQLNSMPHIADRFTLKPLAYENEVPAAVGDTPQRTVDRYMMEADQCDIFICILWSKMGTPVIDEKGKEYQSGTEDEFTTAYRANQKNGKPAILLYRSMKGILPDADFKRVSLVQGFFKRFEGTDAEFKGLYKKYGSNEEFRATLFQHINKIISEKIQLKKTEKPTYVPVYSPSELPAYPAQLRDFVTQNRADEITKALTYLQDHRILLISGIGGVGKTTLARQSV